VSVTIHDFRVVDRVLAETDPESGDVVYVGRLGTVASPFVVARTISGPGGVYIDAADVLDADGRSLGTWEKQFELDGESKPRELWTEIRGLEFSHPGTYTLQYSIFDDVVGNFPFTVAREDGPASGIVPGALDAALDKSTIAWLRIPQAHAAAKKDDVPYYAAGRDWPIWYGYKDGRVYVLDGPGEQHVPGLVESGSVMLIARSKDKRSHVAEAECIIEVLPKDASWDEIARDLLLGRRLNLKDGDAAVERWKKDCEILVLAPLPPATSAEQTATA
jgi:hypothetical protein